MRNAKFPVFSGGSNLRAVSDANFSPKKGVKTESGKNGAFTCDRFAFVIPSPCVGKVPQKGSFLNIQKKKTLSLELTKSGNLQGFLLSCQQKKREIALFSPSFQPWFLHFGRFWKGIKSVGSAEDGMKMGLSKWKITEKVKRSPYLGLENPTKCPRESFCL